MEEQKLKLEELLAQLNQESRIAFVEKMAGETAISQDCILEVIEIYTRAADSFQKAAATMCKKSTTSLDDYELQRVTRRKGAAELERAAELAQRAGMKDKALELYKPAILIYFETSISFPVTREGFASCLPDGRAREVAERAGLVKMVQMLDEMCEKDLIYVNEKAAKLYEELGDFRSAIRSYAALRKYEKVADLIQEVGLDSTQKYLIKQFEEEKAYGAAALIAQKAGMEDKAQTLFKTAFKQYETEFKFKEAAELAQKAGMEDKVKLYQSLAEITSAKKGEQQ